MILPRIRLLKLVLCGGILASIVLSPRLWLSSRTFPLVPALDLLPPMPPGLDMLMLTAVVFLLFASLLLTRPKRTLRLCVISLAALALQDQTRWQPYYYQFGAMLLLLSFYPWEVEEGELSEEDDALRVTAEDVVCSLRLIVVAVYFWSGLQKVNVFFTQGVFPWITRPLTEALGVPIFALSPLAPLVPFVEILLAWGLLTAHRNLAVLGITAMHVFILLSIGPSGHWWNSAVWPWNVAMISVVALLFYGESTERPNTPSVRFLPGVIVTPLFCLVPALNFLGMWDDYLSFSLYSGVTKDATVLMSDPAASRLHPSVREYLEREGEQWRLPIYRWSLGELNVPPYPETRVYRAIAARLCGAPGELGENDLALFVMEKPYRLKREVAPRVFRCQELLEHEVRGAP